MVAHTRTSLLGVGLSAAMVLVLASCQDEGPISSDQLGPLLHISDGGSGGNSEFFFLPPLAPGPDVVPGDPNPDLRPFVRICETEMAADGSTLPGFDSAAGCVTDVTQAVTGSALGLEMVYQESEGIYQVNWSTLSLEVGKHYRIEVWGLRFRGGKPVADERAEILASDGRWLFGWRDITNSPSVASCQQDGTQDFCRINYGQGVPIKAWIGEYVFCPVGRNCSVKFIASGEDATLGAILDGNTIADLFIPGQTGTDFAIGFEPCGAFESTVDGFIDLPTFGDCVRTVPQPGAGLLDEGNNAPAVISFCSTTGDHDPFNQFNHHVLHHFSTEGDDAGVVKVEAWPHASSCPVAHHAFGTREPEGGLARFVHNVRDRALELIAPRRLVARSGAAALDIGIGGQGFDLRSFWKAAVPAKFDYVTAGDHFRTLPAGSTVELEARVVDLFGQGVAGATVRWRVVSSPDGTAKANPPLIGVTDANGIARVEVELSEEDGDNVFEAWGRGIANAPDPEDPDALPLNSCALVAPFNTSAGTGACNGPRGDELLTGPFDPFMPLGHPHMGDGVGSSEGDPVRLATGVLEFTVYGCVQGRGTPTIDGSLGEGEWDCANSTTFPVNLSGGSGTATLYWMNDDTHMYMAVAVPGTDRRNSLRIEWHRNDQNAPVSGGSMFTGTRVLGTDVWEFHPEESVTARDMFIDNQCSGSSATNCGQDDSAYGGQSRTTGGFSSSGGWSFYEIAHPLNSGDVCNGQRNGSRGCLGYTGPIDLVAQAGQGQVRGFFLSLRMGSGAQGNTVWPGFLNYLAVEIK
jgi:hypothetical protein